MLPKRLRIKDASLFQKAFRGGKPFFFENIACKALFFGNEKAKIGFALSKKLFPRAVDRNRIKRMLSRAVSEHYRDIPDGWSIVFFLKNNEETGYDGTKKAISGLIEKLKRYKI